MKTHKTTTTTKNIPYKTTHTHTESKNNSTNFIMFNLR